MSEVLGLQPFVPSKEFGRSKAFYEAIGFLATYEDSKIAIMKMGDFSFILQDFYVEDFAANCMVQLLVSNVDEWWVSRDIAARAAEFAVREPVAPSIQPWGLRVGFIFDPCGVLWHVTQASP